jgi:hypothetical protein
MFKFSQDIKYKAMDLMMKVDLNDLVSAKFSSLIEAMLFIVVEAVSFLEQTDKEGNSTGEGEINTLEFVRDSYFEKLEKIVSLMRLVEK